MPPPKPRCPQVPALIAGVILLLSPAVGWGHAPELDEPSAFDSTAAIAYSQAAIGRDIGNYTFLDRQGGPVKLADYRGRPVVLNMLFTGCTRTCPVIVQSLYRAVEIAQDTLGAEEFSVVTVGFDSRQDTPERLRAYAREQGVDLPNWAFLSSDHATIDKLAADLGFIYFPSPRGFDHLAQTTVIDSAGKVFRQVYGADFDPPALVEPLKDLILRRTAGLADLEGLIDRVRLFCTFYDPVSERYVFDRSIFIALFVGSASLMALGFILLRAWLRLPPTKRQA
jgi:protein SCO1/2